MKKITLLSLLLTFAISSSVQAIDWVISFVVWEGNVYEVKEEIIEEREIGKSIGEVKTEATKSNYYGKASNAYPVGTKYYEIKGISTSDAIAVKEGNQWIKAVYVRKAPFHIMNILANRFFIFSIVIIALILIGFIFQKKIESQNNV